MLEYDLINTKDIMKIFNVARTTVVLWRKQGILKAYGIGRKVYFKKTEVEQVLISIR